MSREPVTATIIESGSPGVKYGEPVAELADGRKMPMGWNIGQTFPVGTTGTAQYIRTSYAGLWKFFPDEA